MWEGLLFLVVIIALGYFSWEHKGFYRASNNVMILLIFVAILGLGTLMFFGDALQALVGARSTTTTHTVTPTSRPPQMATTPFPNIPMAAAPPPQAAQVTAY